MPHDVSIDGQAKQVAASWDELSPRQLLLAMPILYGQYRDPNAQRLELLQLLLGISRALLLRLRPIQLVQVLWLTDFLLDEVLDFTQQLLPVLRLGRLRSRYYGPSAALQNLSFLEFVFADSYFVAYAQGQQEKWRHLLLATLYRPQRARYRPHAPDYGGDRRQEFNENLLEGRALRLAALPPAVQLAVCTWYRGCRTALEARYPHVFARPEAHTGTGQPGDWGYVLRELSGQAFGSFAETARQNLHDVLAKLNDDLRRAQELARQSAAA